MSAFLDSFAQLVDVNEGGFVDNPADPGGATKYGVTERVARAHGYTGAMQDLPLDMAQQIARAEYWDKYQLDAINPLVAFQVFDAVYNGGPAIRWLQQSARMEVTGCDGVMGPNTIAMVNAAPAAQVVARFNAYRLQYMAGLPTWPSFARGWARRIAYNLLYGEQ
jgi:lysozyme family protein